MPPKARTIPPTDEEISRAFRACKQSEPAKFEALLPEVMWAANSLSKCLAVCWEWGLLSVLTVISGLVPQDRFEPAPSISIPSAMWVTLLQPGASNSSGAIKVQASSIEIMFTTLHRDEINKAKRDAEMAGSEPPAELPPKRVLLAGGGSLAATGMQMSQPQNRSAALTVEPELEQLLSWFTAESSIDKGAPAKLWDNATWHRPVMEKSRAFSVYSPWFGSCCAGHVPELFRATKDDVFGLRDRCTISYGEPRWMPIEEIRQACYDLPVDDNKPETFLAGLAYPVLRDSVNRPGRTYKAVGEAQKIVDGNFDEHLAMQKVGFK